MHESNWIPVYHKPTDLVRLDRWRFQNFAMMNLDAILLAIVFDDKCVIRTVHRAQTVNRTKRSAIR